MLAIFAIPGHLSQASFAIAPLNIVPFGLPLSSFKTTAALSSNLMRVPSALLYSLRCLTITAYTTCFLMSGFPLLTAACTKSPTPQLAILPLTVFNPTTVKILSSLAPELSQVSTLLYTGSALVTLAFNGCILCLFDLFLFRLLFFLGYFCRFPCFHFFFESFFAPEFLDYNEVFCLA